MSRRKSSKWSLSGLATLALLGLMLGGNGGEDVATVSPTPPPKATITATVTLSTQAIQTPTPAVTPTDIPTPSPFVSPAPTFTPGPTPTTTKMVWVSKSGTRYHCVSTCSNMKNPTEMTEEEAIAKGRKPCQKCY